MQVWKSLIVIAISVMMFGSVYYLMDGITYYEVNAEDPGADFDEDGRPDEFEIEQGLNSEENDIEWTFLVYCCGDDVPAGNRTGTLLLEIWEFIEKLSWVGCTDNITIVVQFDGTDVLNSFGNHQDMFWNDIPNNRNKPLISGTTTRRFLVGHDSKGWNPSINLLRNCTDNTVIDLFDVTNWDPMNTGKAHSSLSWEANMADPNTLFEFISWGMDTFISDNYCLYIDSHGDGVKGFGYDYRPNTNPTTTTKDVLNLSEIKTVSNLLSNENPKKTLDMVMLQSCFMGNLEFCTEFSSFSDYYVASENIMHTTGNQDDKVLEQLDLNPSWSSARLAREFIDVEWTYSRDGNSSPPWNITDWATSGSIGLTFSNMNNTFLSQSSLLTQMSIMNTAIQNGVSTKPSWYNSRLVSSASSSVTDHYSNGIDYTQIDYYHFVNYWANCTGPVPPDSTFTTLKNAAINIKNILYNANVNNRGIKYEKHDTAYFTLTKGIAIYCPDTTNEWLSVKPYYQYSTIEQQTGWGHVVECILAARGA